MLDRRTEHESEAVLTVAKLMCMAARTAPKGKGVDTLSTAIVSGDDLERLASEMDRLADLHEWPVLRRDAGNLRSSVCCVLIGAVDRQLRLKKCGLCGFVDCRLAAAAGARCTMNLLSLGIALGSAAGVAACHHVDNRIMFTVGLAARSLRWPDEDVFVVQGIPLSATGKSPYFDR